MSAASPMVTADQICWTPFREPLAVVPPPRQQPAQSGVVLETAPSRALAYEDLVIQDLADGEAAARERVAALSEALALLETEYQAQREAYHTAVGMLALTTYERDRGRVSLLQARTYIDALRAQIMALGSEPVKMDAAA